MKALLTWASAVLGVVLYFDLLWVGVWWPLTMPLLAYGGWVSWWLMMDRAGKAQAVYDAMVNNCPDCHHPWKYHIRVQMSLAFSSLGCNHRRQWAGLPCKCWNNRPADIEYEQQTEYELPHPAPIW